MLTFGKVIEDSFTFDYDFEKLWKIMWGIKDSNQLTNQYKHLHYVKKKDYTLLF